MGINKSVLFTLTSHTGQLVFDYGPLQGWSPPPPHEGNILQHPEGDSAGQRGVILLSHPATKKGAHLFVPNAAPAGERYKNTVELYMDWLDGMNTV